MGTRWTQAQAWAWYDSRPWIVGCNFVPSTCINVEEIWQEFQFEDVIRVVDRELAIAAETGLNSVRMLLPFFVWKYQGEGFKKRIDRFLTLANRRGITLMPILFDDCGCRPKRFFREPRFGKQPDPVPGVHGGVRSTELPEPGEPNWHLCDDLENWPLLERYVRDIVRTFASDERIIAWDIWNEPGNSGRGNASAAAMEAAFSWAREEHPVQPLTAGPWEFYGKYFHTRAPGELSPIESKAVELSDVVSFHYYGDLDHTMQLVNAFKRYGRPVLITEWLHRPFRSLVETHLPFFKKERIGCYHWGLVNGKTQTHEPWDWIRGMNLDFSLWQHDIYKGDGTPYREEEIRIFRQLTGKEAVEGQSTRRSL